MKRKLSLYVSVLLWVPAFAIRAVLVLLGFILVPITDEEWNSAWGNNEHPEAPDWYQPGWKERAAVPLAAFAGWSFFSWIVCYFVPRLDEILFSLTMLATSIAAICVLPKHYHRDYMWRAWRNPANNVRFWFKEPKEPNLSGHHNPEESVRAGVTPKAWRWAWSFPFAEYWRVWRTDEGEIAEFRIGWKFSGVPGFGPTLQWRKGD